MRPARPVTIRLKWLQEPLLALVRDSVAHIAIVLVGFRLRDRRQSKTNLAREGRVREPVESEEFQPCGRDQLATRRMNPTACFPVHTGKFPDPPK